MTWTGIGDNQTVRNLVQSRDGNGNQITAQTLSSISDWWAEMRGRGSAEGVRGGGRSWRHSCSHELGTERRFFDDFEQERRRA